MRGKSDLAAIFSGSNETNILECWSKMQIPNKPIEPAKGRSTRLWKVDRNVLLPGDVLLERGTALTNAIVRGVDRGKFSHALIWVGPTDFFEAVGEGTRVIAFRRFIVENPNDWRLLRLESDRVGAEKAAHQARSRAHIPYDTRGAVLTKVPRAAASGKGQFCSELVAACYLAAGIELVPGKPPHKVTPRDLEKTPLLTSMPSPFVEITDEVELEYASVLVDRDAAYAGSLPSRELMISQAILETVRSHFALLKDEATASLPYPPRNLQELLSLLQRVNRPNANQVADVLLEAMRDRGYFGLLEGFREVHASIELRHELLRVPTLPPDLRLEIESEFQTLKLGWLDSRARHWKNFDTFGKTDRFRPHALWKELAAMHRRYENEFDQLIKRARSEPLAKL